MMRATTSVGPAGENGTMTLTARVGYSLADCAAAFCAKPRAASASAAENSSRHVPLSMYSSLDFSAMLPLSRALGQPANGYLPPRILAWRTPEPLPSGLKCPDARA